MLHSDDNDWLLAAPPEVILLLKGMLPDAQYHELPEKRLERTRTVVAGAAGQ